MYEIGDEVIYQGADKSAYKRRGVVAAIEEKDGKPQLTVALDNGEEFTAPIDDWSRAFTNAAKNATVRAQNSESAVGRNADFSMTAKKVSREADRYVQDCNAVAKAIRSLPSGADRDPKAKSLMPTIKRLYRDGATDDIINPLTAVEQYPTETQIRLSIERRIGEGRRVLWGALKDAGLLAAASNSAVSVRTTNPTVANALNARTAKNDITPYGAVSGILALKYYEKKDDVGNGVMIVRAPKDEVEKYLRARAGSYPYKIDPYRGGKWTKVTASTTWNAQTAKNAETGKEFYNKIVLPVNALIASFSDVVQTANRYTEGLRIKPQINEVRSAIEKLKASLAELRG